jgi:hypothetical protein
MGQECTRDDGAQVQYEERGPSMFLAQIRSFMETIP